MTTSAEHTRKYPEISLQLAQEYKGKPYNPEVITKIWRAFLPEVRIPECDWTEEQIADPIIGDEGEPQEAMMVFLPDLYRGKEGLINLGKRFPEMNHYSVQEGTPIVSDDRPGGWIKIEASVTAPNRNTTEYQLIAHLESQGRYGQREEVYILGAQFSKRVNGQYFDEDSIWPRLFGSRCEGYIVRAGFSSDGPLHLDWGLGPWGRDIYFGGRSEGVLQKA
ncbi:MAG: hypothetical protein AABX29_00100 [Nanoarchaeota archaeon]